MSSRVLLLCLCVSAANGLAETIEFPEDEIATETVLPVFDRVEAVKTRNVQLKGGVELGGGVGMSLNEPFYNPVNFHLDGTYYFTETSAVNIVGIGWMNGLNSYGTQLQSGQGLTSGQTFDASLAPRPQYMVLANYQFNAYYGKISISKQSVMNLTLFGDVGVGYLGMTGMGVPVLNLGIGQNFYFTNKLALRIDLRLDMFDGPDPTSQDLEKGSAAPSASSFSKIWYFDTMLTAGLVYLL